MEKNLVIALVALLLTVLAVKAAAQPVNSDYYTGNFPLKQSYRVIP